ncbi:hypothetical protein CXF71_03305, partial [Colwellia sp. 12G3]
MFLNIFLLIIFTHMKVKAKTFHFHSINFIFYSYRPKTRGEITNISNLNKKISHLKFAPILGRLPKFPIY